METRDASGAVGSSWTTADRITFAGVLHNPCDHDVTFTTLGTCLVATWEAIPDHYSIISSRHGVALGCGQDSTDWTVPAGESIEDTLQWWPLVQNTWTMTVTWADAASSSASATFDVTE